MITIDDFKTKTTPTWCPGCGNFGIWLALRSALVKLSIPGHEVVIVYGVGCHGNMRDWMKVYGVEGLHGRALPLAQGIKLANPGVHVICVVGDGDTLGEGGNHFLHAAKRNPNITVIIHDNQVYGLTTGQAAPTAQIGMITKSTPDGVIDEPVNPVALAYAVGGSFVGRGFSGDIPHLTDILAAAISHKGFSVVDILQPCVTFDKVHTYDWYRERVYQVDASYDPTNEELVTKTVKEWGEKIPTGIIFQKERLTNEDIEPVLAKGPLWKQEDSPSSIEEIITEYR
jgi:2-oxoglutarate ferredoxin oxidoreductase subunit beta